MLVKNKAPKVRYKKALDKLAKEVLFPEKLADANRVLKAVGTPKSSK